ncbi:MAG: hypothetical protein LBG80_01080, partial [Bacteroidales bacterium]|nr:hypothetical protein [Bacteroidales bacterium]
FNEVIRLFLCDIPLLLRLFCWGNKVEIRFLFSMFEHPTRKSSGANPYPKNALIVRDYHVAALLVMTALIVAKILYRQTLISVCL